MINLLPHRQQRIKIHKRNFWFTLSCSIFFTITIIFILRIVLQQQTRSLNKEILFYQQQIKQQPRQQPTINRKIVTQQIQQLALIKRRQIQPLRLLLAITAKTPASIHLTKIKTEEQILTVTGITENHYIATQYLLDLKKISILTQIKLREIATNKSINFNITGTII